MEVCDLIEQQDEALSHRIEFFLWPKKWRELVEYLSGSLEWKVFPFNPESADRVPNKNGIYTFLIQPCIAYHPACSYLVYVGKAERKTLRVRFKDYVREVQDPKGRPRILRLNKHQGHVYFCCTEIVKTSRIEELEKRLISAYLPPYNDNLPAEISRIIKAFR